jgi:hypothetical protein
VGGAAGSRRRPGLVVDLVERVGQAGRVVAVGVGSRAVHGSVGQQLDQGVGAALAQGALVVEPVDTGSGPVGSAQPGEQGGLADRAEVEQGAQPTSAPDEPEVVALDGQRFRLGALVLASHVLGVGGVVDRRRGAERLYQGLAGTPQVSRRQRPRLHHEELASSGPVVVTHVGQQGNPVEDGHGHGRLLGGHHGVGEGGLDLRMPPQPRRLPVPGCGVGAGQPEPVTQPPLRRRRAGGLLQAAARGLAQQRGPDGGGAALHLEGCRECGLHLRVGQLPELRAGHLVEAASGAAHTGDDRVLADRHCLAHVITVATTSDTTRAVRGGGNPFVDKGFRLGDRVAASAPASH